MSYRDPPAVLPSLRDLDTEEAAAPRATSIGLGFGLYCYLSAREPFILGELREERRARESAAAAPCPAFTVGPPVFRPHPPPTALLSADKMVSE